MKHKIKELHNFQGNYAMLKTDQDTCGLINKQGEWVLEPEWEFIQAIDDRFAVCWSNSEDDIWEFRSLDGTAVAGGQYCYLQFLGDKTHFLACDPETMLWGCCTISGDVVFPFEYEDLVAGVVHERLIYRHDDHYGLLSYTGERVTEPVYDNISLSHGEAQWICVQQGSVEFYIDHNGNRVLEHISAPAQQIE